MPLPTDRNGYVHGGVLVEFRLNTTDELLWESSMKFVPPVDAMVPYAVGDEELSDYTVVDVRFEFRKVTIDLHRPTAAVDHHHPLSILSP